MTIEKITTFLQATALLALSITISGCSPSLRSVVKTREDKIDAFSTELHALKESLPTVPTRPPEFLALDTSIDAELPYFHIKDDHSNTAILFTDVMADIRTLKPDFEGDYFDFPGTALDTLLKMAHPEKGKDVDGWFSNRVDRLLESRYLLILDLQEEREVKVVDDSNFSGGILKINGHFYDRKRKLWMGSFPIQGIPTSGYAFGEERDLQRKMIRDIQVNAKEAATEQIDQILENGVGGLIEFDYDGLGINGESVPSAWE